MELPERLEKHRGKRLATAGVTSFPSGSVLGTHTLLLTDHPALYVHDTGGLLGEELYLAAEPFVIGDEQLFLLDQGATLRGTCQFDEDQNVGFETREGVPQLVLNLCPHSLETGQFDSGLPISICCDFEEERGELLTRIRRENPELPTEKAGSAVKAYATPWKFDAVSLALGNHAVFDEFPARVRIDAGRLQLLWQNQALADLPLAHLSVERKGKRQVFISTATLVCGQSVKSTSLWFQSEAVAEDFMQAVGTAVRDGGMATTPWAVANNIQLDGRGVDGELLDGRFDALLSESALEFRAATGEQLHRFDLADPALRITGTSEAFLVADAKAGPVQVTIADRRFQERIHEHPRVKACAERTLTTSPFPVRLGGELTSIDARDGALYLSRASGDEKIGIETVEHVSIDLTTPSLTLAIGGDQQVVLGQTALLCGLHTAIHREQLVGRGTAGSESLLRASLGREGDYLLYSIFGPFYELHAAMCQKWGRPGEMHALALPDDAKAQVEIAMVIAQAADQLLRHLDMVAFYLPSFLVRCDAPLIGHPDCALMKRHEMAYRSALQATRSLSGELSVMRDQLLRIEGVKSTPGKGYGGASISLAAASIVAPFFLMSGVQQALGAYNHNKAQSEAATDSLRRILDKWNYWIETLLPAFSHHVIDGMFQQRSEIAQRASVALADSATCEAVTLAIAERLARLETFLLYPEEASVGHSRSDIVKAIKAARSRVRYTGFQSI